MTQAEIDEVVRAQVKAIAEDAAAAIRNIIAVATADIQSRIIVGESSIRMLSETPRIVPAQRLA